MTTEIQTKLMRGYGLSEEDCNKVVDLIATETMTRYLEANAGTLAERAPQPLTMQTTVGVGDQAVTQTWINTAAIAEHVAPQVTEMVVKALAEAARGRMEGTR